MKKRPNYMRGTENKAHAPSVLQNVEFIKRKAKIQAKHHSKHHKYDDREYMKKIATKFHFAIPLKPQAKPVDFPTGLLLPLCALILVISCRSTLLESYYWSLITLILQ